MQYFYFNDALTEADEYKKAYEHLQPYFETLVAVAREDGYTKPECSIKCPFDSSAVSAVTALATRVVTRPLKYLFVIGIGGSALGTKALYEALHKTREEGSPETIFFEGPDPYMFTSFEKHIFPDITSPEDMLVVLISKSGNTMETTVNFEWLYALFSKKFGDTWLHRIVVISNDNSTLFLKAQEKKWHTLNIPEKVGGRFSVLTSAGLFPLLVAGFDIQAFVGGAQAGREQALVFSDTNPFLQRAITRYLWYTSGFTIETLFLFSPQLKALGGWYRQLTAESLGKESATTRKLVALFPEVACGPEDLHSTEQLYFGSLRTQSTSFLSIRAAPGNTITDGEGVLEKKEVMGKKVSDIVSAIQQGVEKTYRDHKKPFIKTELATLSLYDLGEFMQGVMIETMLLARLFGVNAFDQPDVEHYKKETQAILRRLS